MSTVVEYPGAAAPPPGQIPDLDDPEDILHTINLTTQLVCLIIITPFVLMRVYTRWKIVPPWLLDDWCCLISFVLSILYSSTALAMNRFGGGYHVWEITPAQFQSFNKALYADTVVYGPNAWFVKVTLLLVVIRVFSVNRSFVIFGYGFIAAMLGYYLPVMIIKINICRPISGFWDSSVKAECFNQRAIFVADTVISAVTDLAVLLMPVPLILKLRMPWQQKLKVHIMLGAGGIATMASFIRMFLVIRLQQSNDQTIDFVRFNLLGTAEVTIGLICACLPALNKFFAARNPDAPPRPFHFEMKTPRFLKGSRLRPQRITTHVSTMAVPGNARDEEALIEFSPDGSRQKPMMHSLGSSTLQSKGSTTLNSKTSSTNRSRQDSGTRGPPTQQSPLQSRQRQGSIPQQAALQSKTSPLTPSNSNNDAISPRTQLPPQQHSQGPPRFQRSAGLPPSRELPPSPPREMDAPRRHDNTRFATTAQVRYIDSSTQSDMPSPQHQWSMDWPFAEHYRHSAAPDSLHSPVSVKEPPHSLRLPPWHRRNTEPDDV